MVALEFEQGIPIEMGRRRRTPNGLQLVNGMEQMSRANFQVIKLAKMGNKGPRRPGVQNFLHTDASFIRFKLGRR